VVYSRPTAARGFGHAVEREGTLMRWRFRILCLAGVVGVAGIAVAVAFAAGKKPAAERSEYDFGTKVITVQFREAGRVAIMSLKEAKVVRLGDRQFLVGTTTDVGDSNVWEYRSLKVWTPMEDVVKILEYADVEKADQGYRDYQYATKRAAAGQ
jgi:hypothetical protein